MCQTKDPRYYPDGSGARICQNAKPWKYYKDCDSNTKVT